MFRKERCILGERKEGLPVMDEYGIFRTDSRIVAEAMLRL